MDRDASDGDIKKAFRKLARELHPDVNPRSRRRRAVPRGLRGLRGAEQPRHPRAVRPVRPRGHGRHPVPPRAVHGLLEPVRPAGRVLRRRPVRRRPRRPARGGDAAAAVELTLAEAAFGVTREVDVDIVSDLRPLPGQRAPSRARRRRPAPPAAAAATCSTSRTPRSASSCRRRPAPPAAAAARASTRPAPTAAAAACGARREPVEVQIPAGIMTGQRLRLAGRGHAGEAGAPRGDLYVERHGGRGQPLPARGQRRRRRCSTCRSRGRRWGRA